MSIASRPIPSDYFFRTNVLGCFQEVFKSLQNTDIKEKINSLELIFRVFVEMENEEPFRVAYFSNEFRLTLTEDQKFGQRRPVWQAISDSVSEVFRITFQDQKECATFLKESLVKCKTYLEIEEWLRKSKEEIKDLGLSFSVPGKGVEQDKEAAIVVLLNHQLTGQTTRELLELFILSNSLTK